MQTLTRLLSRVARAAATTVAITTVLAAATSAHAQAAAPVDAEKQKLIDHVLALWHPENAVVMAVQRPAAEAMEKSRIAMQQAHMTPDKLDKNMKDIAVDVQKYIDTASPMAKASAQKSITSSVVPLLAQNFSNDELRQLITMLESPVKGKFEKLIPQIDQALGKKVQEDVGPEINKDIQAMTQAVGTKLRVAVSAP